LNPLDPLQRKKASEPGFATLSSDQERVLTAARRLDDLPASPFGVLVAAQSFHHRPEGHAWAGRRTRHQLCGVEQRHQRVDLREAAGLLGDQQRVAPRINLGVADVSSHQRLASVPERLLRQLALRQGDRTAEPPALSYAGA
jgi:hypothetical protein